jgi:translation initiation factor IF-3
MKKNKKQHLLNREIKASQVRVAEQGIMSFNEALELAESQEMDLVLIGANASPPVCKIMNYEKFIYEQSKKPKQKSLDMKEVKLSLNISENDISYRIKQIINFLEKGHSVKITLFLKGRELMFVDNAMLVVLKFILNLKEYCVVQSEPKLEDKKITSFIKPLTKK